MEIIIKDTLRKLRREKGITQEQLATHLNITQQSVGKWERGEGLPDIALLPEIALYFGVTIDDLLGVGETRIKERIEAYQQESHDLWNKGDIAANIALWEKANTEFPSNNQVKHHLMDVLVYEFWSDVPRRDDTADRIIALGEDLLAHSTDNNMRDSVIQTMCFTYDQIGDKEKAKEYAMIQGSYWTTCNELLTSVLTGDELLNQCQYNIQTLADLLTMNAGLLTRSDRYTTEEKMRIYRFCIDLMKMVYGRENYGFYACRVAGFHFNIARICADRKDTEGCLAELDAMIDHTVYYDTYSDGKYSGLLVNSQEYSRKNNTKNYTESSCSRCLTDLQNPIFDFVRDDPRFIELTNRLQRISN